MWSKSIWRISYHKVKQMSIVIYTGLSPQPLNLEDLSKQDFLELVEGLEAEFQREFTAITVDTAEDRVLLVGLMTDNISDRQFEDGLNELERLVDTAGGKVLQVTRQKRDHPHPQTVIGSGKVAEIALQVQTSGLI
jgi:GTP-binding protein HflX